MLTVTWVLQRSFPVNTCLSSQLLGCVAIRLRQNSVDFTGTQYLSTNHGAIPYGEDRLDWEGSLNGTYRSDDLRCELTNVLIE